MTRLKEIAAAPFVFGLLIWYWLRAKLRGEHYDPPDFG
jgi:hypothetical protein